ncbi:MAG: four-carbon acid sugar kinase family protein [Succinivibrio sp.]|jgi:uncharacterized protein YgbK (DUF1537 family)|nr:four-carbon acid sugar kinase family protein [Succinivibrio sp.]
MKLVIVADDLTGSSDSAVQFAALGLKTCVSLPGADLESLQDLEVLVCDTESRDIAMADAVNAVSEVTGRLKKLFPEASFYKKTDSTLRGHPGAETAAMLERCGADFALFAPAFIKNGRTTVQGCQLLHGVKLEDTEMARIPKSPVSKSYIPDILGDESTLKSAVIPLEILKKGKGAVSEAMQAALARGAKILITDATSEEHLELAALCAAKLGRVLWCGSAGLARAIAPEFAQGGAKAENAAPHAQNVLVLAGSISASTRAQTKALAEGALTELFRVNPEAAVSDPEQAAEADARAIQGRKLRGTLTVSGAYEEQDVEKSAAAAKALGISFFEAGERMARYMAKAAKMLSGSADAFVLTGGDTAIHACRAMGAQVLEVLCEVEPGIPLTRIASGPQRGKYAVTKAGAFGTQEAFVKAVKLLQGKA